MYLVLFLIQVFKCQFPFVIVVIDGQRDFEEEGELYIRANELLPIGEKGMPLQNNTKNRKKYRRGFNPLSPPPPPPPQIATDTPFMCLLVFMLFMLFHSM